LNLQELTSAFLDARQRLPCGALPFPLYCLNEGLNCLEGRHAILKGPELMPTVRTLVADAE